jgi:hypothetical protein
MYSSNDEMPTLSPTNRRRRASRLRESLYCIGGCQKMLILDCFPNDYTGICKNCVEDQPVQRRSTKQSLDGLGRDPGQIQPT